MTEQEQNFLTRASIYEEAKENLRLASESLDAAMRALGVDKYIQDPSTGIVYKIEVPTGTFISFKSIGYKRTAKEGERGGTVLSKKEAEEHGFSLKK